MKIDKYFVKGQYRSTCIVFCDLDLSLLYVLLTKIDQYLINRRFRSNHFVRDSNFLKTFAIGTSMSL